MRRCGRYAMIATFVIVAAVAGVTGVAGSRQLPNAYRLVAGWPQVLPAVPMGWVSWVDVDSTGLMYVFRRCPLRCSGGTHPTGSDPAASVLLFDSTGMYLREWTPKSGGRAKDAHGLRIDRNGFIWTTDTQLHVVRKYQADGTLLMTLGRVGVAGETPETFNQPTNVHVAPDDSIFVTDGYGNQRVVKFGKDGTFIKAWGRKGTAPGEFRIPHDLTRDHGGRLIVADRCGLPDTGCTDGRVQIFDGQGKYLAQWIPPGGVFAPQALAVDASDRLYIDDTANSKIWILEAKSMRILETLDGVASHGMAVSATGDDIYLTGSAAGVRRYSRPRR